MNQMTRDRHESMRCVEMLGERTRSRFADSVDGLEQLHWYIACRKLNAWQTGPASLIPIRDLDDLGGTWISTRPILAEGGW